MSKHIAIATSRVKRDPPCTGNRIDITIMTGLGLGEILAPTWSLVHGVKLRQKIEAGEKIDPRWKSYHPLTDEQYTEQYLAMLRQRYAQDPDDFNWLLGREELVLCCYCPPGEFCHRILAANVMEKIARQQGYEVTMLGEIP